MPQYRILANIRRGIDQVGEIAERHGVSQPAMSKMVEGLVQKRLVRRVPHPCDRRQIHLHLTPKGDRFFEETRKKAQLQLSRNIHTLQLQERDRRELLRALCSIEEMLLDREIFSDLRRSR
jgi:DNA-binding MarR family transcriptional regulator